MKAKFRPLILSFLFIGITVAFSGSCKKTTEDLTTTCVNTTGCLGKTFKTCANATGGGYYEYNGVKYSWTGSDPSSAATALVAAMGCK